MRWPDQVVKHKLLSVVGVSAAVFLLCLPAAAQVETGAISGFVLDPSEKPVPKASVTIENSARSFTRSGVTNSEGYYEFDSLSPAEYTLKVDAPAFSPLTEQGIRVAVDQRVRLDPHVVIATRAERILVAAQTPAIQSDSSELGAVLDQDLINDLPLNERDFLQLALLLPGVAPSVAGSQNSTRGQFAMHSDGGREEDNNFLLDGVDNNDSDTRGYVLQPSVDAIQEFKIASTTRTARSMASPGPGR